MNGRPPCDAESSEEEAGAISGCLSTLLAGRTLYNGAPVAPVAYDLFLSEVRQRGGPAATRAWSALSAESVIDLGDLIEDLVKRCGARDADALPAGTPARGYLVGVMEVGTELLGVDIDRPGLVDLGDLPEKPDGSNLALLLDAIDQMTRDLPCRAIGTPVVVERYGTNIYHRLQFPPFAPAGGVTLQCSLNHASVVGLCAMSRGMVMKLAASVVDDMRDLWNNNRAIAPDENGEIIDFDFNHNEIYNSSAEHAEARLIRRIFSLNQAYDHWQVLSEAELNDIAYSNVFNGVTIYTSLESCAQCSGVMTLASCLRVIYLQSDPGQYLVGNLLYNLSRPHPKPSLLSTVKALGPKPVTKYWAPEPLGAQHFGFDYKQKLEDAYMDFLKKGADETNWYFWKVPGKVKKADSLTSFLCTDAAREIFDAAAKDLQGMTAQHGDFKPARGDGEVDAVKSNAEALDHARSFLRHALKEARRGTPHR